MKDKRKEMWDKINKKFPFLSKYKKYILAVAMFALVITILYFFTGEEYIARRLAALNSKPVSGEDYIPDKEFEIDAHAEVNELIATYFDAYVNADFETLEMIARPMSEMEESYIDVMTQYYEEFQNIKCYTKHGLSKDSYIVSAYYEIKFLDIEQTAPSLVLFYVQTDENGELYINNLYSDFNRRYRENVVNKDINLAFIKYATQDDYIALHHEVDNAFKALILENEEIYILTKRTIPALRQDWEDNIYYVHDSEDDTDTEPDSGWIDGVEPGTDDTELPPETQEPPATEVPPTTEAPPATVITKVKVRINNVNIRQKATTDSKSLGKADKGDIYEIKEKVTGDDGKVWIKIDYNGKTGYIRSDFLTEITE